MRRFVRWFSAVALGLVTIAVLQPALPAAAAAIDCGLDCRMETLDAICWEFPRDCQIQIIIEGNVPRTGLTLNYRTVDGRATAPDDYVAVQEGVVTLLPGARGGQVTVHIEADARTELTEQFFVQFYAPSSGKIISDLATVTVLDGAAPKG